LDVTSRFEQDNVVSCGDIVKETEVALSLGVCDIEAHGEQVNVHCPGHAFGAGRDFVASNGTQVVVGTI